MLNFFANYAKIKAASGSESLVALIAKWDPKGASAADIADREEFLDEVGSQLVGLRRQFNVESTVFNTQFMLNTQRIGAAEDLQRQVQAEAEGSPARTKIEASLNTLLGIIEKAQPNLDAAKNQKADTESWLKESEDAYKEALQGLRSAKSELEQTQRGLAQAKQRNEREQQRTQEARVSAGLRPNGTRLGAALNAMKKATEEANRQADEARLKRESLKPTADAAEEDPVIAAALARAAGTPPTSTDPGERLAALKAHAA